MDGPPLTGSPFIDRWREDTLDGLFDFIKARMPQQAPGSLSDRPVPGHPGAPVPARTRFPPGSSELTVAAVTSTLLVGPNGPQPLPSGALVGVVGCLSKGPLREWTLSRAGRPSRARDRKRNHGGGNDRGGGAWRSACRHSRCRTSATGGTALPARRGAKGARQGCVDAARRRRPDSRHRRGERDRDVWLIRRHPPVASHSP